MTDTQIDIEDRIEASIAFVRDAIRAERPYLVGGPEMQPVKLNQNESPYDLPPDLKAKVMKEFLEIPVNRYPREHPWELRERLASSLDVTPDALLIGNGSNELTQTVGLCFIERGAPVVLPRPMFSLYESVVRMHAGRVVAVGPKPDLSFDVDALLGAMQRERPNLTIITSPNNPTGLALSSEDIERLVASAPGILLVDEAYWEFNGERSAAALLADYPHLLILRTFSKAIGMAGMRIGYLLGHPRLIAEILKARLPFMIDRFAETVALAVLDRPQLVAERVRAIQDSLHELREGLVALPDVALVPTSANFLLFRTPLEPVDLLTRLANDGVLVRNMGGYPELRGYLRANAGTPAENKALLVALERALAG